MKYEKYIWSYYSGKSSILEYFNEYDKYGNLTSHKMINADRLEQYDTYRYSYDSEGNILVKWKYSNLSGGPILQNKEVYFY